MKKANIYLADGFEDMEALAVCDVLRRGGVDVNLVSIEEGLEVCSSHKVRVMADCILGTEGECDVMVFPGGMPGAARLSQNKQLINNMIEHYDRGAIVAAICAAPGLVLSQLGSRISGANMTCFDGFEDGFVSQGACFLKEPVVSCGRIITGRSAGYAVEFGLEIVAFLASKEKLESVKRQIWLL